MRRLKPVHISILTILVFVIALIVGMQTDWWETEGRKTPLDEPQSVEHSTEEYSVEEDHEVFQVTGSSTVQDALFLGLTQEQLEEVLEGPIEDLNASIKVIAQERGLKFGEVKDTLNSLIQQ